MPYSRLAWFLLLCSQKESSTHCNSSGVREELLKTISLSLDVKNANKIFDPSNTRMICTSELEVCIHFVSSAKLIDNGS